MKWTIMILTQPSRAQFLSRLITKLGPQVAEHEEDVEISLHYFDKNLTMGENRQWMVESAWSEYICFVDDDDLVADDYVARIYPLLDGEVDYVGFMVQTYIDGKKLLPTSHSLRHEHWFEDGNGAYRDISHLNPIKRELALRATHKGGYTHDQDWASQLRAQKVVTKEHFISDVMYFYYYRSNKRDDLAAAVPA